MIHLARLGAADLDQYKAMNRLFAEVFEEPETYAAVPGDAYIGRLAGRDEFIALTASLEGELAGALVAYELPKYEQQRSEIYIYDLAAREDVLHFDISPAADRPPTR